MIDYYRVVGPLLRRLDPELAHGAALFALRHHLVPGAPAPGDDPRLAVELWGKRFANPLGLAAGFDKNATVMGQMLRFGFGFVEVGSVTPRPQPGNPRPRMFRLPEDGGVINRLGFNNEGVDAVAERLAHWRRGGARAPGLVGVNLGKNKDSPDAVADYVAGARRLGPFADYVVVNVSSPNTPGLRALQGREPLERLIAATLESLREVAPTTPLLLKIAPDLDDAELDDVASVTLASGIAGLVVSNTTLQRPALRSAWRDEAGGLSGQPLFDLATGVLRGMRRRLGARVPLIGVGGVASGAQAYAKIRAGASLVQLYTGLVYGGLGLVARIKRDLVALLAAEGIERVGDAVGLDVR